MAKIGFTSEQFEREVTNMAVLGRNKSHHWVARFGYSQPYICHASHAYFGDTMKRVFHRTQLRIVQDMVIHSNLSTEDIAKLISRTPQWLSREYGLYFGETMTATRKRKLWSNFK